MANIHANPSQEVCKPILPKVIALIYNPSSKHIFVYVNPKYQNATKIETIISNSTANNLAYVNQARLVYSGNQNIGNTIANDNWESTYDLVIDHELSMGNGALNIETESYVDGQNSQASLPFIMNQIYYSYNANPVLLKFGTLYTSSNISLGQQKIIGASISKNTLIYPDTGLRSIGMPVFVYLDSSSQVQVFKEGKLIYAEQLTPGKHQLNTKLFPTGSYNILIKTINRFGVTSTKSMLFSKFLGMPSYKDLNYSISTGFLSADNDFNNTGNVKQSVIPRFSNTKVVNANITKSLTSSMFYNFDFIAGDLDDAYFSGSLSKFYNYLSFTANQTVSTNLQLSSSLFGGIDYDFLNYQAQISYTKYLKPLPDNALFPLNEGLSIQNSVNINASSSLSFSVSQTYTNSNGNSSNEYGASLSYQTFSTNDWNSSVNLNFTNGSNQGYFVGISLNISFFNDYLNLKYNSSAKYQASSDNIEKSSLGVDNSLSADTSMPILGNGYVSGELSAENDSINGGSWGASLSTYNPYAVLNTSYISQKTTKQFSGTLTGGLVYTDGSIFFQQQAWSNNAGIITYVKSPENTEYGVFDNGYPIGTAYANKPFIYYFRPYTTHNISINAKGARQYRYSQKQNNVIVYPGNFQTLNWTFEKEVIFIAYITDKHNKPLKNAVLYLGNKPSVYKTDDLGMIQANILAKERELKFEYNNHICKIKIPNNFFASNKNYIWMKDARCLFSSK